MADGVKTGTVLVNGIEHSIKCSTTRNNSFSIEAQNLRTGEIWSGDFTKDYIENVTRKTGSFKQYSVFLNMLVDALNDADEQVFVELLTYSDLLAMRTGKHGGGKASPENKRYLILTYKVRYDTVHYPMPLQYAGKHSPIQLQDNVSKLQAEIELLKNQIINVSSPAGPRKRRECCRDTAELKREIAVLRKIRDNNEDKDHGKMISTLQNALKNLENDLIREKNKYQRTLDKKSRECRQLVEEVENLRAENRALTVKLRSVTTELSIAKRDKLYSYSQNRARSRSVTPDSRSLGYSRSNSRTAARSGSADRSRGYDRSRGVSVDRSRGSSIDRSRNSTRGSSGSNYGKVARPQSRSTSRGSARSAPDVRTRTRTPSPAGSRLPRFDPSAYVQQKQRRMKESSLRRDRHTKTNTYLPRARSTPLERPSPSSSLYHKPPPSSVVTDIIKDNIIRGRSGSVSSVDSRGSRCSSGDKPARRGAPQGSGNKKHKPQYSYPSGSESENENKENRRSRSRDTGPYLNSPNVDASRGSNLSFTKDSEIAEIDARLNALQSYLKDAQNKQYAV